MYVTQILAIKTQTWIHSQITHSLISFNKIRYKNKENFEKKMMKCSIMMLLLSFMVAITTVSCAPPPPPQVAEAYLLVFQWPKTVCKLAPRNKPCQEPYASQMPQNFKVHGLWPTSRSYGSSIINCPGPDFSYSALNSIKDSLIVYWPNLRQRQREFLEYQWNKHGKCSGYNQYDYFNKGLELSKAHSVDIKTALADANIRPGGAQILRGNIRTAIHKKFHVLCRIACKVDTSGVRYLQEIRFCLDANFVIRDCPELNWFTTDCGAHTDKLIFPVPSQNNLLFGADYSS